MFQSEPTRVGLNIEGAPFEKSPRRLDLMAYSDLTAYATEYTEESVKFLAYFTAFGALSQVKSDQRKEESFHRLERCHIPHSWWGPPVVKWPAQPCYPAECRTAQPNCHLDSVLP